MLSYSSHITMEERCAAIDLKTPRNVSLTAFYRRSFAFHTVKNRMPVIITQLLDTLVRKKEDIRAVYGKDAQEELKTVIGEISKMKYEIQTNKPLTNLISHAPDIKFYNDYLLQQSVKVENPTYFNAVWLHTECYMYRRLREIFELTTVLKDFDPFQYQKAEAFASAFQLIIQLGSYLHNVLSLPEINVEEEFIKLLKFNLWGNKCDLSITNGSVNPTSDHISIVDELNANILSDYSTNIWDTVSSRLVEPQQIIDIVLDNGGYELFSDFCLADFIVKNKLAEKIRFYVKTMPWFISDVTANDFTSMLQQLKSMKSCAIKKLADRWNSYVKNKVWTVEQHGFWTLPVPFTNMATIDPDLYRKLGQAKLIIFKGDLNYRKLFGEKNWDPTTPINEALQGFNPSKLCALRTLKADIVCGLREGLAEEIEMKSADWMVTGDYGVIQFSEKVVKID